MESRGEARRERNTVTIGMAEGRLCLPLLGTQWTDQMVLTIRITVSVRPSHLELGR